MTATTITMSIFAALYFVALGFCFYWRERKSRRFWAEYDDWANGPVAPPRDYVIETKDKLGGTGPH